MLFNSFQYILFLPLVLVVFHLMPKKYRWIMLLIVSYYFYMCWKPAFAILMFISTIVDYWAGIGMANTTDKRKRKGWMMMSLCVNLGMLFFFKYLNFLTYNVEVMMAKFNIFYDSPILHIILPVGISFYTFQTLSYTLDVYKGKAPAERHFGYFALYVSYFPQLVAGPIERPGHLIPQLHSPPALTKDDVRYGINKILLGYFKKVVVADNLALYVDQMFAHVPGGTGLQYYVASVMFIIQLFADFSGYTDIAIGSARLMGVRLQENFNRPFFTTSLSRFWARWHMSLTT
ncbi:MAG: MBOAT family protein, partial [Flavobacteriales bacterium]